MWLIEPNNLATVSLGVCEDSLSQIHLLPAGPHGFNFGDRPTYGGTFSVLHGIQRLHLSQIFVSAG